MQNSLKLSPRDKMKIDRLYLKGYKPSEICAELPGLQLKPRQVTRFLYQRGLTKQRSQIEAGKQKTALEILRRVREEGAEEFETLIQDIATGLKIDAKRLRDGWELVSDAAGASSLMRAKNLLLDRASKVYGTENQNTESPTKLDVVSMFYIEAPLSPAPKRVETEVTETDATEV